MNQAIKLNPNFSNAFLDRGIAYYDKRDFDRAIPDTDPLVTEKPSYVISFNNRGSSYENRREGDRIIQDAGQPIRNNQYNAFASALDMPAAPAGPVTLAAAQPAAPEPVKTPAVAAAAPEPVLVQVPLPTRAPPRFNQYPRF
jgi:tetratricopeptide (TPR) repeat protein